MSQYYEEAKTGTQQIHKITDRIKYLGWMIPLISRLGGLVVSFMMSILPDALRSIVAVPLTVRFIGKPALVGMMILLSMNIELWLMV